MPIEISEDWKLSNNLGASGWSREDGIARNALLKAAYGATNAFSHSLGQERTPLTACCAQGECRAVVRDHVGLDHIQPMKEVLGN